MKRRTLVSLLSVVLLVGLLTANVYAAGSYQDKDIPIGSSSKVLMVGEIEPTVMSVTIPSYVPFHISRSVEGANKVISPRINMVSHSGVPVSVDVVYTSVDLSNLSGASWSNGPDIASNQIAIGFQVETRENQMPSSLEQTQWLAANTMQNLNIAQISPYGNSVQYVVGTLGDAVPEDSTFTVTPTFVVSRA